MRPCSRSSLENDRAEETIAGEHRKRTPAARLVSVPSKWKTPSASAVAWSRTTTGWRWQQQLVDRTLERVRHRRRLESHAVLVGVKDSAQARRLVAPDDAHVAGGEDFAQLVADHVDDCLEVQLGQTTACWMLLMTASSALRLLRFP